MFHHVAAIMSRPERGSDAPSARSQLTLSPELFGYVHYQTALTHSMVTVQLQKGAYLFFMCATLY